MKNLFKLYEGVKYACDETGTFLKDTEGNMIVAKDDAVEFTDVESPSELAKSIRDTVVKAVAESGFTSEAFVKALGQSAGAEMAKALGKQGAVASPFMKEISGKNGKTKFEPVATEEVVAEIKSLKTEQKGYEFHVKTLSELNSLTGELPEEDRQAGVTPLAKEPVRIINLTPMETTTSATVSWVEVLNETGAPATTVELALIPEKDYEFGVFSATVKKIGVTGKMSNEVLEDLPQLASFVQNELRRDLEIEIDRLLISGNGTTEIAGILSIAPTFNATTVGMNAQVQNPNIFDVIRVAILQVRKASKKQYTPNFVVLNSTDVAKLDLTKDANGQYILPPFSTADGMSIKNVVVVENDLVNADEFVLGDFNRFHTPIRRGISIALATQNEDDFKRDIVAVRLTQRMSAYVKTNEVGAFVQGTISTAITDITMP